MELLLSITKLQILKAIHNRFRWVPRNLHDVINHKITKFESNSQPSISHNTLLLRCYQSQNYKIWKQFTTKERKTIEAGLMLSITKLQNLKAIHNIIPIVLDTQDDVINHKITKFESNSQRANGCSLGCIRCYQSQNYKIWKQFTTIAQSVFATGSMLSITKLQNLKAIHNYNVSANWNRTDVINHKITKFESNSQLSKNKITYKVRCYQSQNYKIWKQFTTVKAETLSKRSLLSIVKLQNLKVIHNQQMNEMSKQSVVINHKTTKFESNSQPLVLCISELSSCYQSQNYKIWKQFTTDSPLLLLSARCYQSQNYKIWKQFTTPGIMYFGTF